jgi:hypothetical protein
MSCLYSLDGKLSWTQIFSGKLSIAISCACCKFIVQHVSQSLSWLSYPLINMMRIILSRVGVCDYKVGKYSRMGLVTTYTHHSELQALTWAIANIHNLSLFPTCCVFNSRFLATTSKSWVSSASHPHVVAVQGISRNWTLVNCQLSCSAISPLPSLQSST